MDLAASLLTLMLRTVPPGETEFSVELWPACTNAAWVCEGARWSSFYSGWVRKESAEAATRRYREIALSLERSARALLCLDGEQRRIEKCVPADGAVERGQLRWGLDELLALTLAVMIQESGLREDVQAGRGSAKRSSDDGGRGRGPSKEACLLQVHPAISWRFTQGPPLALKERAAAGDRAARDEIQQQLLQSLDVCVQTGMRMLIHARAYCAQISPSVSWDWATVALYGTGTSCTSANNQKTRKRVQLGRKLLQTLRQTGAPAGHRTVAASPRASSSLSAGLRRAIG